MNQNFISLLEAAEEMAGGNDAEAEMYLELLITDAEDGRLTCIKSWTEGRDIVPGGFSFTRKPGEWRVLRTALKTWMDVRAIHQEFGYRETDKEPQAEMQAVRQARRFQMCLAAGLKMPKDDYGPMPRGIGDLAKREGISRQSFTEDVKAHIRRT